MIIPEIIRNNHRYLRKKYGYTQLEFCELIGVSRASLSAYELGIARMPIEILVKVSEVTRYSLDDLCKTDIQSVIEAQ